MIYFFFFASARGERESEREGKRERRQGEQRRRRCPGLGWAGLLIIFVLLIPPYRSSSR